MLARALDEMPQEYSSVLFLDADAVLVAQEDFIRRLLREELSG